MGIAQSSSQDSQEIDDFSNDYIFVKKYIDARLNEVKLLQEKNLGTKVLQKDYVTQTKKDYMLYLQQFKKRATINHSNILKIFGYLVKREDSFCGEYYKISYFFEYFDQDLEKEILRRKSDRENFTENDLWQILEDIVNAGAYFEENNLEIGDIKPSNILIMASSSSSPSASPIPMPSSLPLGYKLIDQTISGKRVLPNYVSSIQGINKQSYIAPEIFKNIPKNNKPEVSMYKADLFSLGMSIIEAANIENLEGCYDWDNFIFDDKHLEKALAKVQKDYGHNLYDILAEMTDINHEQRPTFLTLKRTLKTKRNDMKNSFTKNDYAFKIEEPFHMNTRKALDNLEYDSNKKAKSPSKPKDSHYEWQNDYQAFINPPAETANVEPPMKYTYDFEYRQEEDHKEAIKDFLDLDFLKKIGSAEESPAKDIPKQPDLQEPAKNESYQNFNPDLFLQEILKNNPFKEDSKVPSVINLENKAPEENLFNQPSKETSKNQSYEEINKEKWHNEYDNEQIFPKDTLNIPVQEEVFKQEVHSEIEVINSKDSPKLENMQEASQPKNDKENLGIVTPFSLETSFKSSIPDPPKKSSVHEVADQLEIPKYEIPKYEIPQNNNFPVPESSEQINIKIDFKEPQIKVEEVFKRPNLVKATNQPIRKEIVKKVARTKDGKQNTISENPISQPPQNNLNPNQKHLEINNNFEEFSDNQFVLQHPNQQNPYTELVPGHPLSDNFVQHSGNQLVLQHPNQQNPYTELVPGHPLSDNFVQHSGNQLVLQHPNQQNPYTELVPGHPLSDNFVQHPGNQLVLQHPNQQNPYTELVPGHPLSDNFVQHPGNQLVQHSGNQLVLQHPNQQNPYTELVPGHPLSDNFIQQIPQDYNSKMGYQSNYPSDIYYETASHPYPQQSNDIRHYYAPPVILNEQIQIEERPSQHEYSVFQNPIFQNAIHDAQNPPLQGNHELIHILPNDKITHEKVKKAGVKPHSPNQQIVHEIMPQPNEYHFEAFPNLPNQQQNQFGSYPLYNDVIQFEAQNIQNVGYDYGAQPEFIPNQESQVNIIQHYDLQPYEALTLEESMISQKKITQKKLDEAQIQKNLANKKSNLPKNPGNILGVLNDLKTTNSLEDDSQVYLTPMNPYLSNGLNSENQTALPKMPINDYQPESNSFSFPAPQSNI